MTAQIPDRLNMEGVSCWLQMDMSIGLHPGLTRLSDQETNTIYPEVFSTNCHRNFIANWLIKHGKLYLVGIIGIYTLADEVPLFAEWYSGIMTASAGKMLRGSRMGYDFRCEREFEIEVQNGMVINTLENRYDETGCVTRPATDNLQLHAGESPSWLRRR